MKISTKLVHIERTVIKGDSVSPLPFNFALEYAIGKVQVINLGLDIHADNAI